MEKYDPNGERISYVRRTAEKDTECYRTLYQEKERKSTIQLSLNKFVRKTSDIQLIKVSLIYMLIHLNKYSKNTF